MYDFRSDRVWPVLSIIIFLQFYSICFDWKVLGQFGMVAFDIAGCVLISHTLALWLLNCLYIDATDVWIWIQVVKLARSFTLRQAELLVQKCLVADERAVFGRSNPPCDLLVNCINVIKVCTGVGPQREGSIPRLTRLNRDAGNVLACRGLGSLLKVACLRNQDLDAGHIDLLQTLDVDVDLFVRVWRVTICVQDCRTGHLPNVLVP